MTRAPSPFLKLHVQRVTKHVQVVRHFTDNIHTEKVSAACLTVTSFTRPDISVYSLVREETLSVRCLSEVVFVRVCFFLRLVKFV